MTLLFPLVALLSRGAQSAMVECWLNRSTFGLRPVRLPKSF